MLREESKLSSRYGTTSFGIQEPESTNTSRFLKNNICKTVHLGGEQFTVEIIVIGKKTIGKFKISRIDRTF